MDQGVDSRFWPTEREGGEDNLLSPHDLCLDGHASVCPIFPHCPPPGYLGRIRYVWSCDFHALQSRQGLSVIHHRLVPVCSSTLHFRRLRRSELPRPGPAR